MSKVWIITGTSKGLGRVWAEWEAGEELAHFAVASARQVLA